MLLGKIKGISTGIKKLDELLPLGGWCPKELYAISGSAKRGKTMALLWFAYCATLQGFNVPYFTCEVSEERLSDRLDAMISETEIKHLTADIKTVMDKLKTKRPTGKLMIFEYPTKTLTVKEVERQCTRLEMQKGISIDMVVTDYAGIMKPGRFYRDNDWKEEAGIYEDLRALAGRQGVPHLTGNQINRVGAGKALNKGTDTGGTWEKIQIVDGNITISGTDEEVRDGILRIHLSEMRNAPSATFKIKTAFGMGRFYKEFVEMESAA
jgi:replicative DNA helicase